MAQKPRKPHKPRRQPPKYKLVSKVRHAGKFLYTFDVVGNDGRHVTIQVVHRNDDKGALRLAKKQFGGYGYGYGYAYAY
jgi:hypothetical protein